MGRKKAIKAVEVKESTPLKIYPLIGHAKQIEFLKQGVARNVVAHAYLFVGPEHCGKERVALEFIAALTGKEVGRLRAGIEYTALERAPDEKKKRHGFTISMDQVRDLKNQLAAHSLVAPYSVVLIKEAETMNRSAGNALLKTLEEPIAKTCLILLASHEDRILPTIRSRCQTVRFSTVAERTIEDALFAEGVARETAHLCARLSGGLPGIGITLAMDAHERQRYEEEADRFFSIVRGNVHQKFQAIAPFVGTARNADHTAARAAVGELITVWQTLARGALHAHYGLNAHSGYDEHRTTELAECAAQIGAPRMAAFLESLESAREDLDHNVNGRLILEHLLLSINTYAT